MAHDPEERSRTKQSEAAACDINNIMLKYRNGGELQHINKALAHFGDFSTGQDFTDAYTSIAQAEHAFAELPAHIRDEFGNNPEAFLYKMQDADFVKRLEEMGAYDPEAGVVQNTLKSETVLDTEPEAGSVEVPGTEPPAATKLPIQGGSVQGGE